MEAFYYYLEKKIEKSKLNKGKKKIRKKKWETL